MGHFLLHLSAASEQAGSLDLTVLESRDSYMYGAEPWFHLLLTRNGEAVADAFQPLSGLQAVMLGRRTAVMCEGGILAFQKTNDQIDVSYHTLKGALIQARSAVRSFQALLDTIGG